MITHSEVTGLLWLIVAVSSGTVGLLLDRLWLSWRDARLSGFNESVPRPGLPSGGRAAESSSLATMLDGQPGPGHPSLDAAFWDDTVGNVDLAAIVRQSLDGPQIDGERSEHATRTEPVDTWFERTVMSWETRYPIPAGAS